MTDQESARTAAMRSNARAIAAAGGLDAALASGATDVVVLKMCAGRFAAVGKTEDGLRLAERAYELSGYPDPLLVAVLMWAGRIDEAHEQRGVRAPSGLRFGARPGGERFGLGLQPVPLPAQRRQSRGVAQQRLFGEIGEYAPGLAHPRRSFAFARTASAKRIAAATA